MNIKELKEKIEEWADVLLLMPEPVVISEIAKEMKEVIQ